MFSDNCYTVLLWKAGEREKGDESNMGKEKVERGRRLFNELGSEYRTGEES